MMRILLTYPCLQGILLSAAFLQSTMARPMSEITDRSHPRKDLHILLYDQNSSLENDPDSSLHFFKDRSSSSGIRTTVYGGNLKDSGSGDKLRLLKPMLEVASPNELLVVADAREVLLNVPTDPERASEAVDTFLSNFHSLTQERPDAVVVSAEEHCCSAAMSHSSPGDFFEGLERKDRACSLGEEGCELVKDNERVNSWKESMLALALDETLGVEEYDNVFLNSGILAGYPANLMKLLNVIDINSSEDDRAVLSDLMLAAPDMIMLDYQQELFGSNPVHKGLKKGCLFESEGTDAPLVHSYHLTKPLILHTPNRFYDCMDTLIEAMGGISKQRYSTNYGVGEEGFERRMAAFPDEQVERKLPTLYQSVDQYGNYGYGFWVWSPEEFVDAFIFGPYGIFSNYGNYGQYGNYGLYNWIMESMFGISGDDSSIGGNGGQYGYMVGLDWLMNYGMYYQYGNYGYGNFRRGLRGRTTADDKKDE